MIFLLLFATVLNGTIAFNRAFPCREILAIPLRAKANNSAGDCSSSAVGFGTKPPQKKQKRGRRKISPTARPSKLYQAVENLIFPPTQTNVSLVPSEVSQLSNCDLATSYEGREKIVKETAVCQRISSRDAEALIRKQYEFRTCNLLVITTDASGGSGRFHGLCSVLRCINGHQAQAADSVSIATRRTRAVQQCTGKRKSRTRRTTRARRIGSGRVLGVPAEISAVSLGLRAALNEIPLTDRSNILLLVDCERTIAYLCDGLYEQGDPIYLNLRGLAKDTASGAISVASVASVSKLRFDGFFDHAAADYLAGIARGRPNQNSDYLIDERLHRMISNRLQAGDLEWLSCSEDDIKHLNTSSGSRARDREEGQARIDRLAKRISGEYGSDTLNNPNK